MARILIVDDNGDNLELMLYLVRAYGHEARAASNGTSAVELACDDPPDLVVCDVHMPDIDGFEVLRRLRASPLTRDVPVLAVTAMAMARDRERSIGAGFDGYISKPIDPETFVDQLQALLPGERHGHSPQRAPDARVPASAPAAAAPRARIVVVDDSPPNRELVGQILTPLGYEVRSAAGVGDGLRLAAEQRPDLVITDLHMPDADGFELVRSMRADPRLAAVPIIVFTSSVWGERRRSEAMRLGATAFLVRPVEPQQLLEEVAACLAQGEADGHDPRR